MFDSVGAVFLLVDVWKWGLGATRPQRPKRARKRALSILPSTEQRAQALEAAFDQGALVARERGQHLLHLVVNGVEGPDAAALGLGDADPARLALALDGGLEGFGRGADLFDAGLEVEGLEVGACLLALGEVEQLAGELDLVGVAQARLGGLLAVKERDAQALGGLALWGLKARLGDGQREVKLALGGVPPRVGLCDLLACEGHGLGQAFEAGAQLLLLDGDPRGVGEARACGGRGDLRPRALAQGGQEGDKRGRAHLAVPIP